MNITGQQCLKESTCYFSMRQIAIQLVDSFMQLSVVCLLHCHTFALAMSQEITCYISTRQIAIQLIDYSMQLSMVTTLSSFRVCSIRTLLKAQEFYTCQTPDKF